jgi:hypothetical protein
VLTHVLELDAVCPIRNCPADSWSASGLDTDGSAGGCVACPDGSGIADLGGASTNNTEAHTGGAQCATGDATVVVGANGAAACAAGLQGAPVFAAGAWAGCVSPPSPPLPPAGGSVASALSLAGVSLDTFDARSVANALASALGVQHAAVAVTVQGFTLSTTLSLAGSATSLTAVQREAIATSLAASLAVPAAQVQLAGAPAAHRRLLQALEVGVTVTGLSSDAAAASQSATLLAAPATMAALVAGLATPSITGATAAPVVAAAELGIAVQAPASSLAGVATALSDSGGASLTAALQANGVAVSGVSVLSPPLVAAPPRPPSPPPAPPSGMSSAVRARIIGGVVGGVLGAAALLAAVLLVRHCGSGASSVLDTTDELKAQMTLDPPADGSLDSGGTWRTFLSRADEVVLGDTIGQGGYASVHAGTWRGTQVAVKVFDVRMQLRLGGGTATTSSQQSLRSDTSSYGREVELLSSLRHPNILAIYALVERPRAMLVMELGAAGRPARPPVPHEPEQPGVEQAREPGHGRRLRRRLPALPEAARDPPGPQVRQRGAGPRARAQSASAFARICASYHSRARSPFATSRCATLASVPSWASRTVPRCEARRASWRPRWRASSPSATSRPLTLTASA